MKTNNFSQLLFALFIASAGLTAQNKVTEPISISGTKFTYPLIEKWISEYSKVNPSAKFKLVQKATSEQAIDLNIIAHQPLKEDLKPNQEIVFAGKYALLPVTNTKNPLFASASKKGLSKKDIVKLFFDVVDYDAEPVKEKAKFASTIYARDNKACASTALASYFGHSASEIRGKKVLGDDIYLLSAIKKDSIGLAYNNLGYLFDTNSRKLKEGIALLPLDLKKDSKEIAIGSK
jgi:phosphate transport system substrate-binding protein